MELSAELQADLQAEDGPSGEAVRSALLVSMSVAPAQAAVGLALLERQTVELLHLLVRSLRLQGPVQQHGSEAVAI